MKTLIGVVAFLAGYGAASYAAAHRALLKEMSEAEVERRTEPYGGRNVEELDELALRRLKEFVSERSRYPDRVSVLEMMSKDN